MLRTLAFAAMLLLALSAHAQDFQKGLDAYNSGDHATALREWTLMAEAGNALPQYLLGVMYGNGWGVAQDYVRAHMWFDIAAAQGYEHATKGSKIVARKLTPAKIEEAQRLAREWLEAHQ
jgi:TPR repeat protein